MSTGNLGAQAALKAVAGELDTSGPVDRDAAPSGRSADRRLRGARPAPGVRLRPPDG